MKRIEFTGEQIIAVLLGRTQAPNSLRRLPRNPLSFVWVYGRASMIADPGRAKRGSHNRLRGDLKLHEITGFGDQQLGGRAKPCVPFWFDQSEGAYRNSLSL